MKRQHFCLLPYDALRCNVAISSLSGIVEALSSPTYAAGRAGARERSTLDQLAQTFLQGHIRDACVLYSVISLNI